MNVRPYIRKTLYVLSIALLIGLFVVLVNRQSDQVCSDVIIVLDAPIDKQLLSKEYVQDQLEHWYNGGISGRNRDAVDLLDIELKLEALPAVKNAEVSFDLRGVLYIDIQQRIPCLRVVKSNGESYYLDNEEMVIPNRGLDPARVPVVVATRSAAMIKKVYTLSTHVQENPFMEALTEQIFVNVKGDLIIVPKIKNQRIIVGDTSDLEDKFQRLEEFYRSGLNEIGWDKYRTINLKFKEQIVCS